MFNFVYHGIYSFNDLTGVISHPLNNSYLFTGKGIGEIIVLMNSEETEHQPVVGGGIVVSKTPFLGGRLKIRCQQTSLLKEWLFATYLKVKQSEAFHWARMGAILRNISTGKQENFKGMSFTKVPDEIYSKEGDFVEWDILFAEYTGKPTI